MWGPRATCTIQAWATWEPCAAPLGCDPLGFSLSPQNSSAPLAEDMDPEVRTHVSHCPLTLPDHRCDPSVALQLARYLNRSYWEKKQEEARKSPTPSAPVPLTEPATQPGEGHAAPAGVVEVRGHSALLVPVPGAVSQAAWMEAPHPLVSCRLPFRRQSLSP